tara:strand:+ start:2107 stop:3120 length:1014 start_codon:yes stop_codon:yes gene_type:complete
MVAGEGVEAGCRIFRPPRDYRDGGVLTLTFFTVIGVAWCTFMMVVTPPDRDVFIILFAVTLWAVPASLSGWMLLKYRRVSLTIEPGTITVQGIFSRNFFDLNDVQKVCWRLFPMGLRVFTTPPETVSLSVSHFSREDQVWLIRYFRQSFPEAIQENWPLYCLHVANRLRAEKHTVVRPPGPDEILITRKRYDRIIIPLILVSAVAGILIGITLHNFALLVLPFLIVIFRFILRNATPREGQVQKRLLADRENRAVYLLLGCWSILGIGSIIIWKLNIPESVKIISSLVLILVLIPVVIPVVMRSEKERKQREQIKAEQAVREWEAESTYFEFRNKEP